MFVGDRGLGIGSRVKGFQKYGGRWKPQKNSLYSSVLITNEHNTSQTCLYCFRKIFHPLLITEKEGERKVKRRNGVFQCINKECPSVKTARNTNSRDTLSSLAIGLAGLSRLLLGTTFPTFNPRRNVNDVENFKKHAGNFLNKKSA
ncbi:hypothetical protein [Parasitella parasitica]|nr:hypothetical protein [Parasitella parasitica]